jgi:hypothetical protein
VLTPRARITGFHFMRQASQLTDAGVGAINGESGLSQTHTSINLIETSSFKQLLTVNRLTEINFLRYTLLKNDY